MNKRIVIINGEEDTNLISRVLTSSGIDESDVEIIHLHDSSSPIHYLVPRVAASNASSIKYVEDIKYSHLSKKHQEAEIKPVRNSKSDPKINRNQFCPCGSGLKYKRCCLKISH